MAFILVGPVHVYMEDEYFGVIHGERVVESYFVEGILALENKENQKDASSKSEKE